MVLGLNLIVELLHVQGNELVQRIVFALVQVVIAEHPFDVVNNPLFVPIRHSIEPVRLSAEVKNNVCFLAPKFVEGVSSLLVYGFHDLVWCIQGLPTNYQVLDKH